MKQPTLADLYFDDEFINTAGVVQGLMSGAKDGDQSYVIDKHNDGTESVYYTTESGSRYFLGVRNPEDIQLAAGPSPVVSDAGAAFGVYPSMGKRTQKSDTGEKMILGAPDFAAGVARGGVSAGLGLGGDIQKLGRFIGALASDNEGGTFTDKLGRAAAAMEGKTLFPSTEDVSKHGYTIPGTSITIPPLAPAVPEGTSAFGMTPEERQNAAEAGQFTGELVGDPFMLVKGASLAGKGIAKGAEYLGPKAAELAQQGIEKTMAPMMPRIVEPGPSMGDAAKAAAPVSDIGFYSAVEKAASGLQRKSGTGQSFLNDISKGENVKADEIKWMGLDDFLRDKKNVTKQEVQDYIAQNRVDVQEVQLGGKEPFDAKRLAQLESEYKSLKQHPIDDPSFGEEKYDELIRLMNIRDQSTTQSLYDAADQATRSAQRAQQQGNRITAEKYFREAEFLNTRAEKLDLQGQGMSNPPKYGQYTLPGGENYREILLTMPEKQTPIVSPDTSKWTVITKQTSPSGARQVQVRDDQGNMVGQRFGFQGSDEDAIQDVLPGFLESRSKVKQNESNYRSFHWDQPNVLAHIRVNDRVDADGKKMLLIEEVQSDWHQAGRDKGYKSDVKPEENAALVKQWDALAGERRDLERIVATGDDADPAVQSAVQRLGQISNELNAVNDRLTQVRTAFREGVPDAPMKDTWYQLALKRALKYAADNGYERVGLTTGARQAERYDLSKQVNEIAVPMVNAADGSRSVRIDPTQGTSIKLMVDKDGVVTGYGAGSTQFSGKKLNEVIGKEMADKVMKAEADTKFSGLDLQVGGEGMKKYYDEIYPKFLEKYGKKWGAQVGETTVETQKSTIERRGVRLRKVPGKDEPIRYIDITPEMRASTSKGQPLFTATGVGAGTAGATMDDRKQQGRGAE